MSDAETKFRAVITRRGAFFKKAVYLATILKFLLQQRDPDDFEINFYDRQAGRKRVLPGRDFLHEYGKAKAK